MTATPAADKEPFAEVLLASSPNGGGLSVVSQAGTVVLDHRDCTGIWVGEGVFYCNAIDAAGSGRMQLEAWLDAGRRVLCADPGFDFHDVRVHSGELLLVCTGTNEVLACSVDGRVLRRHTFEPRGDTWHINCLGVWDGRLVMTAFGRFDTERGYKGNSRGRGFVMDLETRMPLWEGLSQPHTPAQHGGRHYVCNSEEREVLVRDGGGTRSIKLDGYTRGLAFGQRHAYVGLSCSRNADSGSGATARIVAIDLETFEVCAERRLPFPEVYDLSVVADPRPLYAAIAALSRERADLLTALARATDNQVRLRAALARIQQHAVAGRILGLLRWLKRDRTFGSSGD